MIIIAGVLIPSWIIASLFFIQKEQDVINPICYKIFIGLIIIITLVFTSEMFDPTLSKFIGAAEINPSFSIAVIISTIIAAAITGPIACIRYLLWEYKINKEIKEGERP